MPVYVRDEVRIKILLRGNPKTTIFFSLFWNTYLLNPKFFNLKHLTLFMNTKLSNSNYPNFWVEKLRNLRMKA